MFKNHYNIATEGIRAGHKLFSVLGFGYNVEVIVTPVVIPSGGAGGQLIPDQNEYYVTVIITKNKKKWVYKINSITFTMATLENVSVVFRGVTKMLDKVSIIINRYNIDINDIFVKIFKKRK